MAMKMAILAELSVSKSF